MKSHVGMGHDECPICGAKHNEVVLLDKSLRNTLNPTQTIGISECPECVAKINDDYVALVAIDESRSTAPYKPATAHRTGNVVWIKRIAWSTIFNTPAPKTKFGYCGDDVIALLSADLQPEETVQ